MADSTRARQLRPDEAVVLQTVVDLVEELNRGLPPPVALDSRLDEELGLDSLALVELRARLEGAFSVALDDRLLVTATTPAAWVEGVRRSVGHPVVAPVPAPPALGRGEGVVPPRRVRTLTDVLAWHRDTAPTRVHLRILAWGAGGATAEDVTYGALWDAGRQVAGALRAEGVGPGDTVAIMLPTGRDYFDAFTGVLLAGATPVPIYPPARPAGLHDHLRRQARILEDARVSLLVTGAGAGVRTAARLLRPHVASLRGVRTVRGLRRDGAAPPEVTVDPGDRALVQYTSGSTGHPKGVVLTHGQVLANIRAMGDAAAATPADVFVSWLPLYHDMGLIGAWLGSLTLGFPLVVMSPLDFLARPVRWLQAISDLGGTLAASPNFGYELCLRHVGDDDLRALDLSAWRMAFNGAEPVSPETIRRFAERFAPAGFRPGAMAPVYGLAEVGVGVSFPPPGRVPVVDVVDRRSFTRAGRAAPATAAGGVPLRYVGCGLPLPGYQVRVVDAAGRELPERSEGRIEVTGPSATAGYLHDPAASATLHHGSWLDTGDLGYVAGGELYVTGRTKDIVIRAGRNLHPDELEAAVGGLRGIRRGCVAAFASADPALGTERLVVVAETRVGDRAELAELRRRVVGVTVELLGTPPDDVVLAPPGAVAKTSSGKIRRAATRERYEAGTVGRPEASARRQVAGLAVSATRAWARSILRAASGLGYGVAVWLLLTVVAVPVWAAVVLLPGRERRWRVVRRAGRLLQGLAGITLTAEGSVPTTPGPAVVVANHPSFVDGMVVALCLQRPATFVTGQVFAGQRVAGPFLRALGCVFVSGQDPARSAGAVDRLAGELRAGRDLVSFPEGSLDRRVGIRRFHLGAFAAACATGATVLPLGIRGSRDVVRPGERLPRRGAVSVVVGDAITPTGPAFADVVALRDAARAAVCRLSGEPDLLA